MIWDNKSPISTNFQQSLWESVADVTTESVASENLLAWGSLLLVGEDRKLLVWKDRIIPSE